MNQSKRIFDIANLSHEEKEQRRQGIEFLFNELQKRDTNFSLSEAEQLYDKMQQAAIDKGYSTWSHYRTQ